MLFLHQLFSSIWMIDPNYAANYLPLVASWIKGEARPSAANPGEGNNQHNGALFACVRNGAYHISDYGGYAAPEDAPGDSVAVISISGAITKHDQGCGPSGMMTKSGLLNRCFLNDRIKAVVIRVDSGGGEAGAMRLMNEAISQKNKPVAGFIDDYACSAAYGILSGCDLIIANSPLARIGSIGTYLSVVDYSKQLEQHGINLIEVYASKSTDKNKEYYEALKGNVKPLRQIADTCNEAFLSQVQTQRAEKLTADEKQWGTGKVYFAGKALELGLIDGIDTFDNVLNYFNT